MSKPSIAMIHHLANDAVRLGSAIRAQRVFAEVKYNRDYCGHVHADSELVTVVAYPEDAPFMEHPASLNAEPRELYRIRTEDMRHAFAPERMDELQAAEQFMASSEATWLRVDFDDGREMTSHRSEATMFRPQKRRFLPGSRLVPVSHRRLLEV